MAVNCGSCGKPRPIIGAVLQSRLRTSEAGLIQTFGHEDCTDGYHGAFLTARLFVVNVGQADEQFFVHGKQQEARVAYRDARKVNRDSTLNQVMARSLCHDVAVAALGG